MLLAVGRVVVAVAMLRHRFPVQLVVRVATRVAVVVRMAVEVLVLGPVRMDVLVLVAMLVSHLAPFHGSSIEASIRAEA